MYKQHFTVVPHDPTARLRIHFRRLMEEMPVCFRVISVCCSKENETRYDSIEKCNQNLLVFGLNHVNISFKMRVFILPSFVSLHKLFHKEYKKELDLLESQSMNVCNAKVKAVQCHFEIFEFFFQGKGKMTTYWLNSVSSRSVQCAITQTYNNS